jgi:hypothetical protein
VVHRQARDYEANVSRWRIHRCYVALAKETNLREKTRDASNDRKLYEEFEWLGKRIDQKRQSQGKPLDPNRLTTEYVTQEIDLTGGVVSGQ